MQSYRLVQEKCPNLVPVSVGNSLGGGCDGEVFEIIGQTDKVIKFCHLSSIVHEIDEQYNQVSKVLNYLIHNPNPAYAHVYAHTCLGNYTIKSGNYIEQQVLLYYYTMEKLFIISDDERRVFSTLVSHEDREKKKDYGPEKVSKILDDLSRGLDFDAERVTFFCENFRKYAVRHLDVHPRNIMKDSAGNFKLVDFDRAQLLGDSYES